MAQGTGKTVLADRICYEIAAVPGSATLPYDVGFAAPLRQRSDHHQNLEMLIVEATRSRYELDLPQETLSTLLRDQNAVVIFDGLDEVPFSSRDRVVLDISAFCVAHPSVKVIVTSRPGSADAPGVVANFPQYEIAHLTEDDITTYIGRWSAVAEVEPDSYAQELLDDPILRSRLGLARHSAVHDTAHHSL